MGLFGGKQQTPAKRGSEELAAEQQTSIAGGIAASSQNSHVAGEDPEPTKDILLQVPLTALHKVENGVETELEKGSLVAYGVSFASGMSMMALEINHTRWWLRPDMATLKVGALSYMLDISKPGEATKTFFCITFAEDTMPEAVGTFEGLLEEVTSYKESEKLLSDPVVAQGDYAIAQGLQFTNKAASGIHHLSCKVAGGVLMGAKGMSDRLNEHSAKVQAASEPCANPKPVPWVVKSSASMTRAGTKLLSKTAGKVVNATAAVPVYIVDKMTGTGKPVKPGEEFKPQSASSQIMTASAVSFTMVYESLESGAKLVLTGARDSAAGIVGHKYGPDAGAIAGDTLASAGHSVNAYTSFRNIAVKAIARKTAKSTAKRMLYNYMGKSQGQTGQDFRAQAKASVQQHAKSMRKNQQQPQASGSSQHNIMLQTHNSRRMAPGDVPIPTPQAGPSP